MSKASMFALLVSALLATQAAAQIYKTTDADGNVVFTDKPPAGSSNTESVDLQHTNTAPPPPNIAPLAPPSTETEEPASEAVEVSITSPANEATIPMGGGIFDVIAGAVPGVGPGQTLQLVMDGEPQGPPQTGTLWRLENVFRGAHDLTVELRDSDGSIVTTSDPVRVYVLRPGL